MCVCVLCDGPTRVYQQIMTNEFDFFPNTLLEVQPVVSLFVCETTGSSIFLFGNVSLLQNNFVRPSELVA